MNTFIVYGQDYRQPGGMGGMERGSRIRATQQTRISDPRYLLR